MTQADRALELKQKGYDPHSAPGWALTFGDNYGSVVHYRDGSKLVLMNHRPPYTLDEEGSP